MPTVPTINQIIGEYPILKKLCDGESAALYLALNPAQNQKVVLKVPHYQDDQKGLLLESRILAALPHPNIVQLRKVEKRPKISFLVLEFVEGEDLDRLIRRKRALAPAQALAIARDVCSAISCAHARSVVHQNITPANVLVSSGGPAKLTGFSTGRFLKQASDGLTPGRPGPPPITAPGDTPVASACQRDLWSLGLLIYSMLTGVLPREDSDPSKTDQKFQEDIVLAPHLINGAVPQDLSEAAMKALAFKVEDRYSSAQDFYQALRVIKLGPPR